MIPRWRRACTPTRARSPTPAPARRTASRSPTQRASSADRAHPRGGRARDRPATGAGAKNVPCGTGAVHRIGPARDISVPVPGWAGPVGPAELSGPAAARAVASEVDADRAQLLATVLGGVMGGHCWLLWSTLVGARRRI